MKFDDIHNFNQYEPSYSQEMYRKQNPIERQTV
jgi:hypothetical protein